LQLLRFGSSAFFRHFTFLPPGPLFSRLALFAAVKLVAFMSECVNDLTDRASESIRMEVTDDEECKRCTRLESLLMTSPVVHT